MDAGKFILLLLIGSILFSCTKEENQDPIVSKETPAFEAIQKENFQLADSLFDIGLYDTSISEYLNAAEKFKGKSYKNYLLAVNKAAISLIYLQRYNEAINTLDKAKNIVDQIYPEDSLLADYFYNFGLAFNHLGVGDSSKIYHLKALEIRESVFDKEVLPVAESYIGLGNVCTYLLYNYSEGQEYYEKALTEIHNIKDTTNDETLLRCYYNLANINKTLRNLDKAEYYANGALTLASENEMNVFIRYCNNLIAGIYVLKEDYEKSLLHYKNVVDFIEGSSGNDPIFTGITYLNLALSYYDTDDYKNALLWIEKAIVLFEKEGLTDNIHYAFFLVHYGWMKVHTEKEISQAEFIYKGIDKLKKLPGGKDYLVKAYSMLNECFYDHKQYQKSIDAISRGIRYLRINSDSLAPSSYYNNHLAYELYSSLADAQFSLYHESDSSPEILREALYNYIRSDSLIQLVKSKNLLESDEIEIIEKSQKNVENAVMCLKILSQHIDIDQLIGPAIKILEQNKASILYKAVKRSEYQKTVGVPDSLIQKWQDINQQISFLQKENNEVVKDRLLALTKELELMNNYLAANYPNYLKYISGGNHGITLDQLQLFAKETNGTILNFYYDDEVIMVVAINPTSSNLYFISNDEYFKEATRMYSQAFKNTDPTSKDGYKEFTKFSNFLYQELVEPGIKNVPDSIRRLVIIPDKILSTIPFESLIASPAASENIDYKNLDYLVGKFDISYHHSLSFLLSKNGAKKLEEPYFGGWAYTNVSQGTDQLSNLTFSVEEVEAVSKNFKRELYTEGRATESSFKSNAKKYDIIHLSIHGSSTAETEPCLFFNSDPENDGIIYASELYNLKNRSKLIVLSSCESGLGEVIPGEGVMSIARGFFYTGCPSTLISLSSIRDKSSSVIQNGFYNNLRKGLSKDKSLQLAKMEYLARSDKYTAHPANWAPPVLMGDHEAILIPAGRDYKYLIIAAIAIIFIAAIIINKVFLRTATGN